MNKIGRIFEIGYLVVAAIFIYEVISRWSVERETAYIFGFMAVLAVFMFYFRRKMRIKREGYFKNNK